MADREDIERRLTALEEDVRELAREMGVPSGLRPRRDVREK